jgi:hypothetical protein
MSGSNVAQRATRTGLSRAWKKQRTGTGFKIRKIALGPKVF